MQLQTAKITLGEKDYTIQAAGYRRARGWKKTFFAQLYDPLIAQLGAVNEISDGALTLGDLGQYTPFAQGILLDSIDAVFELLIGYAQPLENDRESIEETASDAQIVDAFWEVLKLANPLPPGLLAGGNGLGLMGILQNLPSQNGDSDRAKVTN